MKTLDEAPFVDVFSAEFNDDPGAVTDRLRLETGVIRTPVGASVIRRELVQRLLTDRRLRSSIADLVRLQGVTDGLVAELVGDSVLAQEGDGHARLRKLVNRGLHAPGHRAPSAADA